MSQPLTFSDDEDTLRFSKQLQELDISHLMPEAVPNSTSVSVDKENLAWRTNDRVKVEPASSSSDAYSFRASPSKRAAKILIESNADNTTSQLPLDELDSDVKPSVGFEPITPGNKTERDEWDVTFTPNDIKTPRAGTSTKRRRMLRKIKTEMAEKCEKWDRNVDPDFIFIGEDDEEVTPTPLRLRSSRRQSRISYRNLDWSTEANDRKHSRISQYLIDESEEEREVARLLRETAREARRESTARKRKRTKERVASISSSATVPESTFSISDDDSLAMIAKRSKVEEIRDEEDSDYEGGKEKRRRRRKKRERREESISSSATVVETAFSISDDDSLAAISKRTKRMKVEDTQSDEEQEKSDKKEKRRTLVQRIKVEDTQDDEEEENMEVKKKKERRRERRERDDSVPPTVPESAFSISDDDSLAKFKKRSKIAEGRSQGMKIKEEVDIEEDEEETKEKKRKRGGESIPPTVPETTFSISDDDSLAMIAKRAKRITVDGPEKDERRSQGMKSDIKEEVDSDEDGEYDFIKRRKR